MCLVLHNIQFTNKSRFSHILRLVLDSGLSVWLKAQKPTDRFCHSRSTRMPWNSGITEALQKRIARYVIKHYLGRFIDHPISLDDLTFELVNGRIELTKLDLDVIVSIGCFDFLEKIPKYGQGKTKITLLRRSTEWG